jgi:hypothetical protein
MGWLSEELVLSGTYHCITWGYDPFLIVKAWILGTIWEVLALHLTAWIAVKHIRELRRRPTGSAIGDYLTVLIKYHVFYFAGWDKFNVIYGFRCSSSRARFAAVASFNIGVTLSPSLGVRRSAFDTRIWPFLNIYIDHFGGYGPNFRVFANVCIGTTPHP